MRNKFRFLGLAFVLALTTTQLHAQTGGYTVTSRGPDWKVMEKTTVENGTNRIHQYTELATGLNYTNAYGQLVESKEEITILPTGGAAATQGQHKVYFPADIYNGVLEIVTPDGKHLYSRPLGITYDDGSNTVFIATLKHAQGYLTSSNQVTYRDAFTGFKADLVCTYRRGGFESDLVFRQQPPTPGDYGLDADWSTLQMVTEFFNTQDPEQVPAASDEWYGLQDSTLKFGKLTMTRGKAFTFNSVHTSNLGDRVPVYKRWVHLDNRTFLIEELPVLDLADDLNALPLQARSEKEEGRMKKWATRGGNSNASPRTLHSSLARQFPPSPPVEVCTNQFLLAMGDFKSEPGVVLDYSMLDTDQGDYTFQSGMTYLISGVANVVGTLTIEGGAVIKYDTRPDDSALQLWGSVNCLTTPDQPAIFTSFNDDSVGESIGVPDSPEYYDSVFSIDNGGQDVVLHDVRFFYSYWGLHPYGENFALTNAQFIHCGNAFYPEFCTCTINNILISDVNSAIGGANYSIAGSHVTMAGCSDLTITWDTWDPNALVLTNSLLVNVTNDGVAMIITNHTARITDVGGQVFQTAANANYYLATNSPYRDVGTTSIDSDLLAELQTMTTYAPQDGGMPDTNAPDLGYQLELKTPEAQIAPNGEVMSAYKFSGHLRILNDGALLVDLPIGSDKAWLTGSGYVLTGAGLQNTNVPPLSNFVQSNKSYDFEISLEPTPPPASSIWLYWREFKIDK